MASFPPMATAADLASSFSCIAIVVMGFEVLLKALQIVVLYL
jgi:hypothetical protein